MPLYINNNNYPTTKQLNGSANIKKVYCNNTLVWQRKLLTPILVSTEIGTASGRTNVTISNPNDIEVYCYYGTTAGSSKKAITIAANSQATFSGTNGAENGNNAYYWFTATNCATSDTLTVTALAAPTTYHDNDTVCDIKIKNNNDVTVTVYWGTISYSTTYSTQRTSQQNVWQGVVSWNTDYYFWCYASGYICSTTTVGNAGANTTRKWYTCYQGQQALYDNINNCEVIHQINNYNYYNFPAIDIQLSNAPSNPTKIRISYVNLSYNFESKTVEAVGDSKTVELTVLSGNQTVATSHKVNPEGSAPILFGITYNGGSSVHVNAIFVAINIWGGLILDAFGITGIEVYG